MKYLLDSDFIIDYLRDFEPTINKLKRLLTGEDEIFVSAITNLELHAGKSIVQLKVIQKIDEIFSQLNLVDITFKIAATAGDFRRIYNTPVPDALIAASAFAIDATIITRNLKHFESIKEIEVKSI